MNKTADQRKNIIFFGAFTVLFFALSFLFPLSGDDWFWALQKGFPVINGRYAANSLVMLLVRVPLMREAVKAMSVAAIVYCAAAFSRGEEQSGAGKNIPFAAVLLLILPGQVFMQSYQWTAGFGTYVLPTALFMLTLLLAFSKKGGKAALPLLFVMAIANQLFVENMTFSNAAIALILLLYCRKDRRELLPRLAVCLAGYIAGAALMFIHPAYLGGTADAHKVPAIADMLRMVPKNFVKQIAFHLVYHNFLLVPALNSLLTLALVKTGKNRGFGAFLCIFLTVVSVLALICPVYKQASDLIGFRNMLAVIAGVYIVLLPVAIARLSGKLKVRLLICYAAVALNLAPMFVSPSLGARCFYFPYAVMAVMVLTLAAHLRGAGALKIPASAVLKLSGAALAAAFTVFFYVYGHATAIYAEREEIFEAAKTTGTLTAEDTIEVPCNPYTDFVWQGNPWGLYEANIIKKYYGLPVEVNLVFK